MSGAIEALDEVGGIEGSSSSSSVELVEMQQQRYEEQALQDDFKEIADRALSSAINRPHGQSEISLEREALTGGTATDVGQRKAEILSDIERPGLEPRTDMEANQEVEKSLEERISTLYVDLTAYQVAWRISQKIPQDLSQILKGN